MNFTREPIIETVITPREGCKLVVRNSKGAAQEDYFVDALEVVSFGHSFFFRSQERPKSFLVPVSDYEILETKETRMVLKNSSSDQSIKIGSGRESSSRREVQQEEFQDATLSESRPAPEHSQERKREGGRRRRGRRGRERNNDRQEGRVEQVSAGDAQEVQHSQEPWHEHEEAHDERPEEKVAQSSESHKEDAPEQRESFPEEKPSFISKLFPPPANLVSKESLSRFKPAEEEKPLEETLPENDDEE